MTLSLQSITHARGRRVARPAAGFAAALALAACAGSPDVARAPTVAPAVAPTAEPAPPPPPTEPAFAADDIVGESPASVDALLGAPALARKEGPGEFRRYDLAACNLAVLFFPPTPGAAPVAKSLHASALSSSRGAPSLASCLAVGVREPDGAAAP
ncbi:MAG: hypothetical protein ACFB00_12730 [Parvularculaceae bacterium]